jgi:hypothetical protein
MKPSIRSIALTAGVGLLLTFLTLTQTRARENEEGSKVRCANLVYAVNKSSVCFSDRFLRRLELETNIHTDPRFAKVRLDSSDLYGYPFAIMTGEGGYSLTPKERISLSHYVTHGGFLLASAGCSDPAWTRSFRSEMARIFPKQKLQPIPLSHAIYHTVYSINTIQTHHDRRGAKLEGLYHSGKIVVLFSPDGLNDTAHAENCCCCGGDELDQAEHINVNILAYALLH